MKCPVCSAEVAENALFCQQCGAKLPTHYAPASGGAAPAEPPIAPQPTTASTQFRDRLAAGGVTDPHDLHHVLWEGRYSIKAMAGVWVMLLLLTVGAAIVHAIWIHYGWLGWAIFAGTACVVWFYAFSIYLGRHWSVRYQLTTQRFFHETGVFRHTSDRIEVIAMDDITVTQGPLDRLFGTGQIRILSGDHATPDFHIVGIDHVKQVAEIIDEARRAERNRRGVRVESI
ncbi:MAG TPA: PH domain-containing protein [Pirellulales bacterium]|jgi:membrane protein YdbS with pleckstrin-like domain|nr:PH domain-containing protein [Pirellulales bacterium]